MKVSDLLEAKHIDPIDDKALIRRVVRDADAALKKEGDGGHFKEFDINTETHTLWYVTYGARDSKAVADTIAHFFDSADIAPFTIKVTSNEKWDGSFGQQKSELTKLSDDPEIQAKINKRNDGWATVKVK